MLYGIHLTISGIRALTTLVRIGTDCIGRLLIQLPYDHDHDGPWLNIIAIVLFNINVNLVMYERNK